jgi:general nucleoside transport system permease protein
MASTTSVTASRPGTPRSGLMRLLDILAMPALAIFTAFLIGGILIVIANVLGGASLRDSLQTVVQAYVGLIRGAFFKPRALSETLIATVPYIFLGLGVAVGFKSGLFNIGVEGQFYIGAVSAAWAGVAFAGLPAIILLPLVILAAAVGGGIWAGIPGFLKARFGAHEVITTIMMNYIAFRLTELLVAGLLKDPLSKQVPQTAHVAPAAELWSLSAVPQRLQDPLNALFVALVLGLVVLLGLRFLFRQPSWQVRIPSDGRRSLIMWGSAIVVAVIIFVALPPLAQVAWPFRDQYDRMHIGLFAALLAAVFVWWLMWKTTLGFELRTVGANPNAARYAGVNITRNIVLAMAISGALAGIAGSVEVLGVTGCRCLPQVFSSGYGFDAIAIALLGHNNPLGIVAASFLFGAMRNGADFMELTSGVSKYMISIVQALVMLFVAAPTIVSWMYHMKQVRKLEEEAPLTRGWGGG